jgi:hypothetical protein
MYPYNYKPEFNGIDHTKIFVVMPFAKEYDKVYELIKDSIAEANKILMEKGMDMMYCKRVDEDITVTSGWINVLENLMTAQIILGVLAGRNPNVFYELGIAHSTQPIARQLLIADKDFQNTFDLKDLMHYKYDLSEYETSKKEIAKRIVEAVQLYNIEHERIVKRARMKISTYGFEVIKRMGYLSHFAIEVDNNEWVNNFERDNGEDSFERFVRGIDGLCSSGLLGLNTLSELNKQGLKIEFSYYWTSLGN